MLEALEKAEKRVGRLEDMIEFPYLYQSEDLPHKTGYLNQDALAFIDRY